jgi:hypothetical protein
MTPVLGQPLVAIESSDECEPQVLLNTIDDTERPLLDMCAAERASLALNGSVVYFIECVEMRAIKVGTSECLRRRLQELQCGFPASLVILGAVLGDRRDEQWLHRKLAHLRLRGEWFRDDPFIRRLIAIFPIGFDLRAFNQEQHEREAAAAQAFANSILWWRPVKAPARLLHSTRNPFESATSNS